MADGPSIKELFGSDSDEEGELLQQANEAPPQVSSGAEPDLDDEVEEGGSPERDRTRNINTGEPQHHEALLRMRIGTALKGSPQHMRNTAP